MNKEQIVGVIIAVVIFIFLIWNTNFHGMSFGEIRMVLTFYGVFALMVGGVISYKTGSNIIANMFIGTAIIALLIALLTELF